MKIRLTSKQCEFNYEREFNAIFRVFFNSGCMRTPLFLLCMGEIQYGCLH
jgi:hypothetical protein